MRDIVKRIYSQSVAPHNKRGNDEVMSLWMGRPLSYIEIMSINSYFQNGHKVMSWR